MIGQIITDPKTGEPLDNSGNKLSISAYQPSDEIKKLFAKVQQDYQIAWKLQQKPFDEFDGVSLLQRIRLDQETFGAFVGAEWQPVHKRWRFQGRKNTSRNKLIGILAHMLAGMLYPYVNAKNADDEEDKMTARVMRILVEDHLKKAGYEVKFLFAVLSALVLPAVIIHIEYVEAIQRIKQQLKDGTVKITEAIDELISGLNINIRPNDEVLFTDWYGGTGNVQRQPAVILVRRISYDTARKMYAGRYQDEDGEDLFDHVKAGQTRIVLTGQDSQTLYDIDWNEADQDFVQEITALYRDEDLEVTWVGGVFMGNQTNVYNTNPFKHRRMQLVGEEWISVPIIPIAMSGFEPIDPSGRFLYYKSGAFKEYWDDQALNNMHRLVLDGTYLDVIKPMFLSGVTNITSAVLAPGATIGMPQGATVTPFSMGSNLAAAYNAINKQEQDLSESTQDKIQAGITEPGVTATQSNIANQQAKIFLGVFGIFIADLIKQVGELTMDCVVQYATMGEIDTSVPEALSGKFKTFLAKGKDKGKNITNRIIFTDRYMGKTLTKDQQTNEEWKLYHKSGGEGSDQRIYEVNPYQFARYSYSLSVDPDQIVKKSTGTDRQEKVLAFQMMTDPRVAPFTDPQAVVDDFVIEEFGGNDPDKYKAKGQPNQMMNAMMGQPPGQAPQQKPGAGVGAPQIPGQPVQ